MIEQLIFFVVTLVTGFMLGGVVFLIFYKGRLIRLQELIEETEDKIIMRSKK